MLEASDKIWVTWENQRRNISLTSELNIPLYVFDSRHKGARRYFDCILETLKVIKKNRPKILIVQNPSIILATLSIFLKRRYRYKIVVDAHNSGLNPKEGRFKALNLWASWILKHSDTTIVSNETLVDTVTQSKGFACVLADPLPKIPPLEKQQLEGSFNALFICSWADDEPFLEIIEAAKLLPNDYRIYITGNWKKVTNQLPNKIPDNVVLTGFISTEDFDALLISSQVSIDLTTREGCLVCGAYEALAIAKPQILSDTKTLRKTFSQGAIFTQNSAKDIANAILDAHKDLPTLQKDAELQRTKFISIWSKQRDTFEEHLTKLTRSTYRQ